MTETQLQQERAKAKAAWNLTKLRSRSGQATADDIAQARQVYEALTAAQPNPQPEKPARPLRQSGASLPPDVSALVNAVRLEQSDSSRRKAELSNALKGIPDEIACPQVGNRFWNCAGTGSKSRTKFAMCWITGTDRFRSR